MSWVQTYTGKAVDILDPQPDQIDIVDIAHSLSNLARFNGHTKRFYSVASHSTAVSLVVPKEHALKGLLHDAAEAYISDIPTPVKRLFHEVKKIEDRLLSVIFEKYGLSPIVPQAVKVADVRMLMTERVQLMGEPPRSWGVYEDVKPYDNVQLHFYEPENVKKCFLQMFHILTT